MARVDKGQSSDSKASNPKTAQEATNDAEAQSIIERTGRDLDELKAQYELVYMGIERNEPAQRRTAVKQRIQKLAVYRTNNTALKFRIQQLRARMGSLENYWNRTQMQRDAGTYHRDRQRANRRATQTALQAKTLTESRKVPKKAELTDEKLRKLYATYLSARKKCGESTNLPYEAMAKRLRNQVPELMQRTGAKSVEFKVVIRNGKAVLKALPQLP